MLRVKDVANSLGTDPNSFFVLNCGLHDIADRNLWNKDKQQIPRNATFTEYRASLQLLLAAAKNFTDNIIFRSTTAPNFHLQTEANENLRIDRAYYANKIAQTQCRFASVQFLDVWPLSLSIMRDSRPDRCHFRSRRNGLNTSGVFSGQLFAQSLSSMFCHIS